MYNGHALHWMWQGHQQSQIPRHKHMEHDRVIDACTGCGDVYNTKAHIVHHVYTHHAYLFWSVPRVANAQR